MNNKEIEAYILELKRDEIEFINKNIPSSNNGEVNRARRLKNILFSLGFFIRSSIDLISLYHILIFKKAFVKNQRIVFTSKNFCSEVNGKLEDRIVKPIYTNNIIFINHSKQDYLLKINGLKVYNIGGVVKMLSLILFQDKSSMIRIYLSYKKVNDVIFNRLLGNEVFTLCYYDLNGLSIVFSKYRHKIKLIEVQHGSIINYPPYIKPSPIKTADVFYVKNQSTIDYLKTHLCKNYSPEYRLIPYLKGSRKIVPGLHIFYASTIEFNGLHPVFINFLAQNTLSDLHVIVRLHPREKDKEALFKKQLDIYQINYEFDNSKNWLENNSIENLIVVSPWSSIIEEAVDNGFSTIVIDELGQRRYSYLIDNKICYFTHDINSILYSSPL